MPHNPRKIFGSMHACEDPRDLAAAWFARLNSGDVTPDDRRLFEQWRRAHPENDRQYRHVRRIWDATLHVPAEELREILTRRETLSSHPDLARRRFAWGLAGVSTAAVFGGVAFGSGWFTPALHTIQIASRRGEQRRIVLPDNSTLDVNTGTRAVVRMYADRREITLVEGEIFFAVQPDATRPFVVDAGASRVVVTGTRFNVRHDAGVARVSVQSGSVEVSSGSWWNRQSRSLVKNQGVDVSQEQGLGDVEHRDIDTTLAWQRGQIVFEHTSLADAVTEINRYLDRPVLIEATRLREHRIGGVFSVHDPQSFIDLLPQFAPVRVYRSEDGQTLIVAK